MAVRTSGLNRSPIRIHQCRGAVSAKPEIFSLCRFCSTVGSPAKRASPVVWVIVDPVITELICAVFVIAGPERHINNSVARGL